MNVTCCEKHSNKDTFTLPMQVLPGDGKIHTHTHTYTHIPLVGMATICEIRWAERVSRVWPSHLPGLARSVEIWDRRSDGSIVEWHAYSFPSPFPRQINFLSSLPQKTPHDFHEASLSPYARYVSQRHIDETQFDENQFSHLSVWLFVLVWLQFDVKMQNF